MNFQLYDTTLERCPDRIVVLKQVSRAEEYLADHFPGFPVLPGVLMLESMVQAAEALLCESGPAHVLGEVKALKFGAMVRPGQALRVEVTRAGESPGGGHACKGVATVVGTGETAASGRFTMRPPRRSA